MIKAVIIDDEVPAIVSLEALLKVVSPDVIILGKATSCVDGLKLINEKNPDLVFLDISMPGGTGFDLLELADQSKFEVIFTTAHEKHALQAIKTRPFDYLLKPIDPDELSKSINQLKEHIDQRNSISPNEIPASKIRLSSAKEIVMVEPDQILYLEADGRYTKVYLLNGQSKLVTKNIGDFERELQCLNVFYRIHRSFLINTQKIARLIREDSGYLEMLNGKKVEISPNKRRDFESRFMSGLLK